MSRTLYADTGAFIALLYRRDSDHERVRAHFLALRTAGDRLITSEPVITETVTRLRYDAGLSRVIEFRAVIERSVAAGALAIRESDPDLRRAAFGVLERYADLTLSYADATGAAIAGEGRVAAVFGLDNDFRVMGFPLEP